MQLLQHYLQFLRHRQAKVRSIFEQGNALVGEIEEDNSGPKNAAGSDHVHVQHMADTNKCENQDLAKLYELYVYANF